MLPRKYRELFISSRFVPLDNVVFLSFILSRHFRECFLDVSCLRTFDSGRCIYILQYRNNFSKGWILLLCTIYIEKLQKSRKKGRWGVHPINVIRYVDGAYRNLYGKLREDFIITSDFVLHIHFIKIWIQQSTYFEPLFFSNFYLYNPRRMYPTELSFPSLHQLIFQWTRFRPFLQKYMIYYISQSTLLCVYPTLIVNS